MHISRRFLIGMAAWMMAGSCLGANKGERMVNFAKGQWDASAWSAVSVGPQTQPMAMVQRADSLGTTSFPPEQIKNGLDNVLLMTDTKLNGAQGGQIELTFAIGPERGAAPGFVISPTVKDGALQSGMAVFIADYTMAVWWAHLDPQTGKMAYDPLARLNRWSEPGVKHIVRCRVRKHAQSGFDVLLQVDDSDVMMVPVRQPDHPFNSRFGIWGCHGTCDFYSVAFKDTGTLPWSATRPTK
jgi:hypothetical protein